jgi:hypothetical protein
MSSQYVPPHLREKKPDITISPNSFPTLAGSKPQRTNAVYWTHPKAFSALAEEWNQQAEEDKIQQKMYAEREMARQRREHRVAFQPKKADYDDMESQYEIVEEEPSKPYVMATDEWQEVTYKKYKPELTMEEKLEKQNRLEEERIKNSRTVWDETPDWDRRST